eukprot:58936_1
MAATVWTWGSHKTEKIAIGVVHCVCGSEMRLGESDTVHVQCDSCNKQNPSIVYHCPVYKNDFHEYGYDYCLECAPKMKLQNIWKHLSFLEEPASKEFTDLNQSQIKELIAEYSKFIFLKIISMDFQHTKFSPSPIIDQLWHLHLLYPKKYFALCQAEANGNIIDHKPEGKFDGNNRKRLNNTLELYTSTFGKPHDGIWIVPSTESTENNQNTFSWCPSTQSKPESTENNKHSWSWGNSKPESTQVNLNQQRITRNPSPGVNQNQQRITKIPYHGVEQRKYY